MTSTSSAPIAGDDVTPTQVRDIVKEAYIYGFPMVDGSRIQYAYFVAEQNPEYKGAWNQVHNIVGPTARQAANHQPTDEMPNNL